MIGITINGDDVDNNVDVEESQSQSSSLSLIRSPISAFTRALDRSMCRFLSFIVTTIFAEDIFDNFDNTHKTNTEVYTKLEEGRLYSEHLDYPNYPVYSTYSKNCNV